MKKEYPFLMEDENGSVRRFDTAEHAIAAAETIYHRWGLSVYVSRIGEEKGAIYTLEA